MALVGVGYELSVSLYDTGGNLSTLSYTLRAPDFATAQADAVIITGALDGISDCVIGAYRISYVVEENAFGFPISAEVENKASLTVLLAGLGAGKANIKVPAPKDAIFLGGSGPDYNIVDTGDVAVVNYTDLFKAGAQAYISDGQSLDSVISGKRVHAKSNRG